MRYFIKDISDEKLKEIIAPSSDIICVKKPLMLYSVNIYDRKILLSRISVFIYPFDVISCFAILFKKHFRRTADKACCKSRCIVLIGIVQVFYFRFNSRIVFEAILLGNTEYRCFGISDKFRLNMNIRRYFTELYALIDFEI